MLVVHSPQLLLSSLALDSAEGKLKASGEAGAADTPVADFLGAVAEHLGGSHLVEVHPGISVGCLLHLECVEVGESEALVSVGDDCV